MVRLVGSLLAVTLLAGCRGLEFGPYVSPRVVGQVLAGDTGQPLAGVTVTRGEAAGPRSGVAPHGAQWLALRAPTVTGEDGRFVLPSERVLVPVRWGGWTSVRLTLQRAGYARFQTNYSISSLAVTKAPEGAPLLDAGQIRMERAQRPL